MVCTNHLGKIMGVYTGGVMGGYLASQRRAASSSSYTTQTNNIFAPKYADSTRQSYGSQTKDISNSTYNFTPAGYMRAPPGVNATEIISTMDKYALKPTQELPEIISTGPNLNNAILVPAKPRIHESFSTTYETSPPLSSTISSTVIPAQLNYSTVSADYTQSLQTERSELTGKILKELKELGVDEFHRHAEFENKKQLIGGIDNHVH